MISVVIRVKNEIVTLPVLLKSLYGQTYLDFEIVIVDNESKDGTFEYSKENADKVITITDEEFSHPKSCNLGVQHSSGEYIYFTNGHCLPKSKRLLASANAILRSKSEVAGVYGRNLAYPNKERSNVYERILSKLDVIYSPKDYKEFSSIMPGLLQTTSCCIRRKLLESNPFEEMVVGGGEDLFLAKRLIRSGYKIAYSPYLDVYHSHGGSVLNTIKRQFSWWLMFLEVVLRSTRR